MYLIESILVPLKKTLNLHSQQVQRILAIPTSHQIFI